MENKVIIVIVLVTLLSIFIIGMQLYLYYDIKKKEDAIAACPKIRKSIQVTYIDGYKDVKEYEYPEGSVLRVKSYDGTLCLIAEKDYSNLTKRSFTLEYGVIRFSQYVGSEI